MSFPVHLGALIALMASTFWFTADQQGKRAYERGDFKAAAAQFEDSMWKGVALYRAGEFEQAQAVFARLDSAKAHFNRGNCLVFLGQYQNAIASYDRALSRHSDWPAAQQNRAIAAARAALLETEGGDMGDQKIGADEIVFDKKKEGGQNTEVAEQQATDAASVQALWLRRVQTRPSDFLKAKFAYQQRFGKEAGE